MMYEDSIIIGNSFNGMLLQNTIILGYSCKSNRVEHLYLENQQKPFGKTAFEPTHCSLPLYFTKMSWIPETHTKQPFIGFVPMLGTMCLFKLLAVVMNEKLYAVLPNVLCWSSKYRCSTLFDL